MLGGIDIAKLEKMKRHWVITGWHHPDGRLLTDVLLEDSFLNFQDVLDEIDDAFTGILRYRCAVLEVGEKAEGVHYHVYVESETSIRWSTMCRRTEHLQCRIRPRKARRIQARDYAAKVDDPTHLAGVFEIGVFECERPDERDSPLDDCIQMILDGYTLQEIARTHPRTFCIYGRRLEFLYSTLTTNRLELLRHQARHTGGDYEQ